MGIYFCAKFRVLDGVYKTNFRHGQKQSYHGQKKPYDRNLICNERKYA